MASAREPRSAIDRSIRLIERISGVLLGIATVVIVASAIGRYGFARPLPDAFDLSRQSFQHSLANCQRMCPTHGYGAEHWHDACVWADF